MQTDPGKGGVHPVLHPLLQAAALGQLLVPAMRAVPAVLSGTGHHAWGQQLVRVGGHKV